MKREVRLFGEDKASQRKDKVKRNDDGAETIGKPEEEGFGEV